MRRRVFYIVLIFSILSGCRFFNSLVPGDDVVASVGEKVLLRRELANIIQQGATKADSTNQAKTYVQRWVKHELMLSMAEENLMDDQKDVQRELDEYRTSLIIHRYQQQLINQKLDTVITDSDIRQYYDKHPEQFLLDMNIVKAEYIEMPKNLAKPDLLKRLMVATDDKSYQELAKFSFQYATRFDEFNGQWVDFSHIRSMMPPSLASPDATLRRNSFIESYDDTKYYLVAIQDYKLIGEKAPFEFVNTRIANLIMNTRKMEFIEELEKNIYKKGKDENRFKIKDR
jgi:hypothetical protein